MIRVVCGVLTVIGCGLFSAGCNKGSRSSLAPQPARASQLPPDQRSIEYEPGVPRTIEESDVYKLNGTTLFVQNPARGLAVIDVSDPNVPVLRQQLLRLTGQAGELFVKGADLLVVFEQSDAQPGRAEVVGVSDAATAPVAGPPLLLSGTLVGSRLVGDVLYVVTREGAGPSSRTWVISIDARDPDQLQILDQEAFSGEGHEIHVTDQAVYVAQTLPDNTRLLYVDISDVGGQIVPRGEIIVRGEPQGRFHMNESGTTFRIVTWRGRTRGSELHVVDITNPDQLNAIGNLAFAAGEDLRATQFEGDRAYVVTFEPVMINQGGGSFLIIDPLWVIDLSDPTRPRILGELEVPGWSDYVFPRGNRLVAVGRGGDRGETVAVSLFDIGDPTLPTELERIEFGVPGSVTSEANSDFRGVTILDQGVLGAEALIVVPFTDNLHDTQGNCTPAHFIQLIDLFADDLALRGTLSQVGLVRRTLPIGDKLYSITDKTLAAVDVTQRDVPVTVASLELGDIAAVESCTEVFAPQATGGFFPPPVVVTGVGSACSLSLQAAGPGVGWGLLVALLVFLTGARWREERGGLVRA